MRKRRTRSVEDAGVDFFLMLLDGGVSEFLRTAPEVHHTAEMGVGDAAAEVDDLIHCEVAVVVDQDPGRDPGNPFQQATAVTEVRIPRELLTELGRAPNRPLKTSEEGTLAVCHRTGKLEDKPFLESLPVYRYLHIARRSSRRIRTTARST